MKRLQLLFTKKEIKEMQLDEKNLTTFLPSDFSRQDYPFGKDLEFRNKRVYIETEGMSDEHRDELIEEYKNNIYEKLTGSLNRKVIVSFANLNEIEIEITPDRFKKYCSKYHLPFAIYKDDDLEKYRYFAKLEPEIDLYGDWDFPIIKTNPPKLSTDEEQQELMENKKWQISMQYDIVYKKEFENYLFKMEFEGSVWEDIFSKDTFKTTVFYPSKECMTFEQWMKFKGSPIRQWTDEERQEFMNLAKETPQKKWWHI
ncbi:hypothetical protein ACFPVY_03965 [Flavobacterium qiangtangense]|uniref:Uncharacterized protein n=1 Tax=Flavobacterium qiangtangense TaxID=1442595 RepID=A0ABW1PLR4_9FLAO